MDVDVSSSDGFSHVYNSMNDSLAKTNPIVLIILTNSWFFQLFSKKSILGLTESQWHWISIIPFSSGKR